MKKLNILIYALLALLIAFGLSFYFHYRMSTTQVHEERIPDFPVEPVKKPIVRYPVPEPETVAEQEADAGVAAEEPEVADAEPPTPPLSMEGSDSRVEEAVSGLIGGKVFGDLLIVDNFIQRLVATIDNLPRRKLPLAHVPFALPEGKFRTTGTEDNLRISDNNYLRYTPYIQLLENIHPDRMISTYVSFYPLMQTAYEQLGYPNAYFNDRLVYVIEHLLETPNPDDPLALLQPSVLYTYADPNFEQLSAGQKILLRMGQEQREKVKEILRRYHFRLTNLLPGRLE